MEKLFLDKLWIITDASVKQHGIGATLYIKRNKAPRVAEFYSAKLRKHQVTGFHVRSKHWALPQLSSTSHLTSYSLITKHAYLRTASPVSRPFTNSNEVSSQPVLASLHFLLLPADSTLM